MLNTVKEKARERIKEKSGGRVRKDQMRGRAPSKRLFG